MITNLWFNSLTVWNHNKTFQKQCYENRQSGGLTGTEGHDKEIQYKLHFKNTIPKCTSALPTDRTAYLSHLHSTWVSSVLCLLADKLLITPSHLTDPNFLLVIESRTCRWRASWGPSKSDALVLASISSDIQSVLHIHRPLHLQTWPNHRVSVAHGYNSSYLGGWDWEDHGSRPAQANCSWDPPSPK
jgi:hypothetical protein